MVLLYILGALWGIISYILESAGLFILAERRGIPLPGLAWIPVANGWIFASLADQYMDVAQQRKTRYRYLFLGLLAGLLLLTVIGWKNDSFLAAVAVSVILIVAIIIFYIILYRIFKSCMRDGAIGYLICALIFSGVIPILIFAVRNKDEGITSMVPNTEEDSYSRNYYGGGFFR